MAVEFKIPAQEKISRKKFANFGGVDFTTNELEMKSTRTPNGLNFINDNGIIKKRNGYKNVTNIFAGEKINGIYNYDTSVSNIILIHAGTNLYTTDSSFSDKTQIATDLANNKSTSIMLNGVILILDGKRIFVYGKVDGELKKGYLDTMAYIPTISINRNPDGTNGRSYEGYNIISNKAKNTFLSDGTSREYKLMADTLPESTTVEVKKLDSSGVWQVIPTTEYSINYVRATINFNTPPEKFAVTGRDSIEITYTINNNDKDLINKCTIATNFGYGGNSNRIFMTRNKIEGHRNEEYISDINNPFYYSDEKKAKIGLETSEITGYSRLSDGKLALHKGLSANDCTVYYRSYTMFNNEEEFPIISGTKGVGCVNNNCCLTLQNDNLFLSESGVYAIINSNNESNDRYSILRSYFINGKLQKEKNKENAIAIIYDNKYFLGINGNVYVCDSKYGEYTQHDATKSYQYEWYYWNNINATVFFVYKNMLYFGDEKGNIFVFVENYYKDIDKPIVTVWTTPYNNLDIDIYNKTIHRTSISSNPNIDTNIQLEYITNKKQKVILKRSFGNIQNKVPKQLISKTKIKKFMYVKLILKNAEAVDFSISDISIYYTIAGKYRGDK